MPINITMPALSPTMEEGNLAKWLVKEGDKVAPGDVIAEIETDKATMEVEAVDEGTVAKLVVPAGTEGVKVNSLIAVLAADGEDVAAAAKGGGEAAPAKAEAPAVVATAAPVAGELAVAKPQVVYASVLPFSRSTGLTAPASSAPAVLAAAIEPPVMSPVADPTAPIPRPKPGALASADAETVDASAAEVAVAAADMPVPRPRPDVAIESGVAMSIAPKAAAPAVAAEAAPVVVAQSSVPVPRSRPVETGALQ